MIITLIKSGTKKKLKLLTLAEQEKKCPNSWNGYNK